MRQPSLDELMQNVDSKYTLVVAVAKRARYIMAHSTIEESNEIKPVSTALLEMERGELYIEAE
ncbi:MAG: DNA-directed RNA polymerase subunit omega [Gracilibacteraceae bacterium]|nr:DNA-directed RNA polymerase subunit omega [Gracilibacteraceae bacterium]